MTPRAVDAALPLVIGPSPRALVLGSMPGRRSLAEQRYYAHPRNLFWGFMGELFDAGWEHPYEERLARLAQVGIALWDVLARCERPGSLDSAIVRASEVPNPIPALLDAHPTIALVACNGTKAHELFARHILPSLPTGRVEVLRLPSTSPANASISLSTKRAAWNALAPRPEPT